MVVDPNVYIAAIIKPDGVCGRLVDAINDDALAPIACPLLLEELCAVLSRPKLRRWVTTDGAASFVAAVQARSEIEPNPASVPATTRDADDDYLVALATVAKVDAIISGDRDLQSAALPIPVWSPRDALDRLIDPAG